MATKMLLGLSVLIVIYSALGTVSTAPRYSERFENYGYDRDSVQGLCLMVVYTLQPGAKGIYEGSNRLRLKTSGIAVLKSLTRKRGLKTGLVDVFDYLHHYYDTGPSNRLLAPKASAEPNLLSRRWMMQRLYQRY